MFTRIFNSGLLRLIVLPFFLLIIFDNSLVISLFIGSPPLTLNSERTMSSLSIISESRIVPTIKVEYSYFLVSVMIFFAS